MLMTSMLNMIMTPIMVVMVMGMVMNLNSAKNGHGVHGGHGLPSHGGYGHSPYSHQLGFLACLNIQQSGLWFL